MNLFICHRPYHVLVSSHIISTYHSTVDDNSCVMFDIPIFDKELSPGGRITFREIFSSQRGKRKYSQYSGLFKLDGMFHSVHKISRTNEVRIWDIINFVSFYQSYVKASMKFLERNYSAIENVYIYSDREKQIEILASLAKEKYSANIILVDEGIASYYKKGSLLKDIMKRVLTQLFSFKYISASMEYGESGINDKFMTFDNIKAKPGTEFIQLPNLNPAKYRHIFSEKTPEVAENTALFITNALSEGNVLTIADEKLLITLIINEILSLGYSVIVKAHPVEISNKYSYLKNLNNVTIIENSYLPVEYYYSNEKISFICGITSSALLNAKRNDLHVVSFIKYLSDNQPVVSTYSRYEIFMPQNIIDLSEHVSKFNN